MAIKRGLGKGLDAIISGSYDDTEADKAMDVSRETFVTVKINDIDPNREQPRSNFDEAALSELAESIKQYGVIQPLVVKKNGNRYNLIAGERRWRASRLAGLREVPVVIKDYTEEEIFAIALIENIQREDLNPIEEAFAYQRLIAEHHLKQDELANRVAKSRTAVTNSMRLLRLDKRVQQMLVEGTLSEGHGRTLLAIEEPNLQFTLANKIINERLSVRETEKLVKRFAPTEDDSDNKDNKKVTKEDTTKKMTDLVYKRYENSMSQLLGTKVEIKRKANNKGKIEIEYYSIEELERIMEHLADK